MMELQHTTVFCTGPGGGNPCPVVLGGDALPEAEMQAMAARLGVECVFVLPATQPACHCRLRYFAPQAELSMCGHATIAAVTVLVRRGLLPGCRALLQTAAGTVPVTWASGQAGALTVRLEQGLPKAGPTADAAAVCHALRLPVSALGAGPVQAAATSRMKLLVPLSGRTVLDGLHPDFELLWQLCDDLGVSGVYPFTAAAPGVYYARQFPCRTGYREDPATGVAAGALSAYLWLNHQLPPAADSSWQSLAVYQGQAMGRPCLLYADLFYDHGTVTRTRLCGAAQLCAAPPAAL